MPTNKSAFFRYLLIDKCLTRRKSFYYTTSELIDYIEENIDERISIRTLQADIKEMKESRVLGFYAPIKYSKQNEGYCYTDKNYTIGRFVKIDHEDYRSLEFALNILDTYKNVPALDHFKSTVEKLTNEFKINKLLNNELSEKFIFPEEASFVAGLEFLDDLSIAIKDKLVIEINYHRFGNSKAVKHLFHPYCLKEYNERWYVIGWGKKAKGLIHLALDRINSIVFLDNQTFYEINFDAKEYFKYYYGVTVNPSAKPEKILITFDRAKGEYLKTRHIHKSQIIHSENEKEIVFEYNIIPNYEFISFLMSNLPEIKSIEPMSLKKIILDKLTRSLKDLIH
jgi:predicted DNA-binding transcriptional regulator YafY